MSKDIEVTIKFKVPKKNYKHYEYVVEDFELQLGEMEVYPDIIEEDS
jgi:hypothetical protein